MYRNNHVFGFKFISTVSNVNLLHFRAAEVYAKKHTISIQQARKYLEKQVVEEYEEIKTGYYRVDLKNGFAISNKIAWQIISENPLLFIKQSMQNGFLLLLKPARSFVDYQLGFHVQALGTGYKSVVEKTSTFALIASVFQIIILMVTWLAFLAGVFILFKEKNFSLLIPLLLIILYYIVASSGTEADARLRMPLMPFVFIIAAKGFDGVKKFKYN